MKFRLVYNPARNIYKIQYKNILLGWKTYYYDYQKYEIIEKKLAEKIYNNLIKNNMVESIIRTDDTKLLSGGELSIAEDV